MLMPFEEKFLEGFSNHDRNGIRALHSEIASHVSFVNDQYGLKGDYRLKAACNVKKSPSDESEDVYRCSDIIPITVFWTLDLDQKVPMDQQINVERPHLLKIPTRYKDGIDRLAQSAAMDQGRQLELRKNGISVNSEIHPGWIYATTPLLAYIMTKRGFREGAPSEFNLDDKNSIINERGIVSTLGPVELAPGVDYIASYTVEHGMKEQIKVISGAVSEAVADGAEGKLLRHYVDLGCFEDEIFIESMFSRENDLLITLRSNPLVRIGEPPEGVERNPIKAWLENARKASHADCQLTSG